MKNLWITLPAYAPDYSGICSAYFDLGGISVIHDASGCTGNYTGYDEPRWFGSRSKVFCSGLREIDAVLGNDDKLLDNIIRAGEDIHPKLYAVIGSPVPMVIGADMRGIARELEARTGVPSLGFTANGLELYDRGVSDALCALIGRFSAPKTHSVTRGVNLLGTNPLDLGLTGNEAALAQALEAHGFEVCGKMMMGATLEQVRALPEAAVNLVVTYSGIAAARLLEERHGTPYVAGCPVADSTDAFDALDDTLQDGQSRVLTDPAGDGILIVGEQVLGNSLRRALLRRSPGLGVTIAPLTGFDLELASEGDLALSDEAELSELLDSGRFHTLIGDPLLADLLPSDREIRFLPLPHPSLSSKLHWDEVPRLLGDEMAALCAEALNA